MHTTAHPDDEQGGMLAIVSHGLGARTTLLTLNRGESGDNALGPELFDRLGLIRTEELRSPTATTASTSSTSRRSSTTASRSGSTKPSTSGDATMSSATWSARSARERPRVIVSRWQGNQRDGHGQHQAAGLLTQDAYKAAGDAARFPNSRKGCARGRR